MARITICHAAKQPVCVKKVVPEHVPIVKWFEQKLAPELTGMDHVQAQVEVDNAGVRLYFDSSFDFPTSNLDLHKPCEAFYFRLTKVIAKRYFRRWAAIQSKTPEIVPRIVQLYIKRMKKSRDERLVRAVFSNWRFHTKRFVLLRRCLCRARRAVLHSALYRWYRHAHVLFYYQSTSAKGNVVIKATVPAHAMVSPVLHSKVLQDQHKRICHHRPRRARPRARSLSGDAGRRPRSYSLGSPSSCSSADSLLLQQQSPLPSFNGGSPLYGSPHLLGGPSTNGTSGRRILQTPGCTSAVHRQSPNHTRRLSPMALCVLRAPHTTGSAHMNKRGTRVLARRLEHRALMASPHHEGVLSAWRKQAVKAVEKPGDIVG